MPDKPMPRAVRRPCVVIDIPTDAQEMALLRRLDAALADWRDRPCPETRAAVLAIIARIQAMPLRPIRRGAA